MKLEVDYGYESTHLRLTGDRDENDRELSTRLKLEARVKEEMKKDRIKRKQDELALYERLKNKYEKVK
jgi:hypothetical protein